MGYKGCPVLALHPGFDIVKGMVTDYLHCVLLGVSKTLLTMWLDSNNDQKEFYIGNKVSCGMVCYAWIRELPFFIMCCC